MDSEQGAQREFVLLCIGDRRPLYQRQLQLADVEVAAVDDVDGLIERVVQRPPLALFVDIVTSVKIGVAIMTPIYRLAVGWPILRCKVRPDGVAIAIGAEPPRVEPLENALAEIAREPFAWSQPSYRRRFVRVDLDGRARVRARGGEWIRGNLLNLSVTGAFVALSDPPPPNEPLELEIWDHEEQVLALTGRSVWRRRWEESKALAGTGIAFDAPIASAHLRSIIVRRARRAD